MTASGTYLVDTNSYVRVARSSELVLGDFAGLCLRLVEIIAKECERSPRLNEYWPWLHEPPHPQIRRQWTLSLSRADQTKVDSSVQELRRPLEDTLVEFAQRKNARGDFRPVLSRADRTVLCTAEALGYGVVTDEQPMSVACAEFEIPHMSTLQLLHHLVSAGSLPKEKVDSMVRFWQYEKDAPKGWKKQYTALFGPPAPIFRAD